MTITQPEVLPEGRYTQAQAARALQIDRHTVAKYAEEGLMKFRMRKAGRRKVCAGADIIRIWKAMYL